MFASRKLLWNVENQFQILYCNGVSGASGGVRRVARYERTLAQSEAVAGERFVGRCVGFEARRCDKPHERSYARLCAIRWREAVPRVGCRFSARPRRGSAWQERLIRSVKRRLVSSVCSLTQGKRKTTDVLVVCSRLCLRRH